MIGFGSNTSGVNMITIQVQAEDQIAADKQVIVNADTGETLYDLNHAADNKHYIWRGKHQTIPMGMDGNPEQYAAQLAVALPAVNTLRMMFNENSFNPDGSLHEQYERFLAAAVAEGFDVVLLYAGGDSQNIGNAGVPGQRALSNAEAYAALEANHDVVSGAWDQMLDWLDAHADVKDGVTGYELMNEPAGYNHAIRANGSGEGLTKDDFVSLYVDHVIALSDQIQARATGDILVAPWRYNGDIATLDNTLIEGLSAIEQIAAGVGAALVWSVHLYAGWAGTGAAGSPEELIKILEAHFEPLQGQNVLVTEHNAHGTIDDITGGVTTGDLFTQVYEWFADSGIGIGWFPGTETGGSSLVTIDPDGSLRYLHQHSLAHAFNAASLGDTTSGTGNENKRVDLVAGALRNEGYEIDFAPDDKFDDATEIGFAFGYDGDDTLTGYDNTNDLLYGGDGNDRLISGGGDDFLFGQDGNDELFGEAGINHFFGGRGNDTMTGGSGYDQYVGGEGSDVFITGNEGGDVIVDFKAGVDQIDLGDEFTFYSEIIDNLSTIDVDDDGAADDLQISFGNGGALFLLDVAAEDLTSRDFVDVVFERRIDCHLSRTPPAENAERTTSSDAFEFNFAAPEQPWVEESGFFL